MCIKVPANVLILLFTCAAEEEVICGCFKISCGCNTHSFNTRSAKAHKEGYLVLTLCLLENSVFYLSHTTKVTGTGIISIVLSKCAVVLASIRSQN